MTASLDRDVDDEDDDEVFLFDEDDDDDDDDDDAMTSAWRLVGRRTFSMRRATSIPDK